MLTKEIGNNTWEKMICYDTSIPHHHPSISSQTLRVRDPATCAVQQFDEF